MKRIKIFFSVLIAALAFSTTMVYAQEDFTTTYIPEGERPDGTKFLPEPPKPSDATFFNDFYYYHWGKSVRNTELGALAIEHDAAELVDVYSDIVGVKISPTETPEIYRFCQWMCNDIQKENTHTRNIFKRTRPFVLFNEPSAIPENDEEKKQSWGYPSGHVARSYAYALTLSCLVPEKSAEIMDFADTYALGRVICGHHYKSDTDASLRLATTVFASAIGRQLFIEQWGKARLEYMDKATGVSSVKSEVKRMDTPIYDLSGRRYDDIKAGIFIQNGRKYIKLMSR